MKRFGSLSRILVPLVSLRFQSDTTNTTAKPPSEDPPKDEPPKEASSKETPPKDDSTNDGLAARAEAGEVMKEEPTPTRWVVPDPHEDPTQPAIVDANGEYIVSHVEWPTGEVAYRTPPPVEDKLAPRFGYNVVQVKKHVSWWKYNQKYPRLSVAYLNIQVLFLVGIAWLMAFLTEEYRRNTEALRTPGAMVGEHRGRGPATQRTQKVTFTTDEMNSLVNRAQENWLDGEAEANYIGSKNYKMQNIPRPQQFTVEDFRKR